MCNEREKDETKDRIKELKESLKNNRQINNPKDIDPKKIEDLIKAEENYLKYLNGLL